MSRDFGHVRFISAGAGSGKTYRLTEELEHALVEGGIAPSRVIGTTFTVKAAGELRERVRERLIRSGRPELAEQTAQALIGTVHSVCERLLKRFAFELGLSPELHVASLEDCGALFRQALDEALSVADTRRMNEINARLDIRDADNKLQDWREDVKKLIDRARDNDVGPDALREMGRDSAAALFAHLPRPKNGKWDEALLAAVRDALHAIDVKLDTTIGTSDYVKDLRAAIYQLRRPACPWSVWMSLSHAKATKRSEPIAAKVRAAASVYDQHPLFHADIKAYVESVYAIAAQTLERFQDIKRERGLIDFPDMEQLTLRALDEPAVNARLGAELELLLVDEFQDTNPMQLAIFMKLAALADKVIFVGDVKQAIYAFRGCDPDLVFATLEALAAGGGGADKLEYSWRSRPALVSYINSVFSEAFANEIAPAQVTLEPKRAEQTDEPAVLHWRLDGNNEARAQALARAIAALVASGFRIVDPQSQKPRPVRWGDIAVLAATNRNVEAIALALRAAHVPMKMTLSGLFTVPETCLAKACLRRLNDATDTLATAEIIAMAECSEPEVWLAERLAWLANEDDGYAWAESTHPITAKLKKLRDEIDTQSPVEIVARVLNYVGIREVVTAWGPNAIKAMQRQRNLDALLNLAVEYEHHCDAQHLAATLTGFLFWLEHPHSPELDLQPVVTTGDAVHVLTYHKAKGLEWPIVVNTDFHYAWQSRVWDVRVESDGNTFDLSRPLENRVIRFWPRVFGKRTKAPVLEAILDSATGRACEAKTAGENRRLAYVGLTRARDCIVLALPAGKPGADAWLHAIASRYLLPQGETLDLADGRTIATRVAAPGEESVGAARAPFAPRRLPERTPIAAPLRESVNPSAAPALPDASIGEIIELGERVKLHGEDMTVIGTALHALIAAELLNPKRTAALEHARTLLAAYCGSGFSRDSDATLVDVESALAAARRFRAWLEQKFAAKRTFVEYPIVHALEDGRVVRGWIDVLLETDSGFVVIDHKSSPRPKSEWRTEALEHSGQLAVYARALEAAGKSVTGCWIHFAVGGGVAAVDIGESLRT
jgi:ATP-dependent exoDNAse (exonuclease V) beta subunit